MMDTRTKQARLDSLYMFGIEHGRQLPFEDGDMARPFDDVDFLVLYLAQAGTLMREQAVTAWMIWRGLKPDKTKGESLGNHRAGNRLIIELFARRTTKRPGAECFKPSVRHDEWVLTADGWARVLRLLTVLP